MNIHFDHTISLEQLHRSLFPGWQQEDHYQNIQNIHSRMPVILSFEESIEYLNNDNSYDLKYNTVSGLK